MRWEVVSIVLHIINARLSNGLHHQTETPTLVSVSMPSKQEAAEARRCWFPQHESQTQ